MFVNLRVVDGSFLSTLSLRRATHQSWSGNQHPADFYPRSPCGERPHLTASIIAYLGFLSTLSLRRATHQSQKRP